MTNDEAMIEVGNVSKSFKLPHERRTSIKSVVINIFRGRQTYEKHEVLKNVSFEVKKGEFLGIVGRNGSGKSTMLKLLAGIYTPDKGVININGKLTPFIELGVGFNPELTGRENVYLNGALLGFSRKEMNSMYDKIVAFAELARFMDQKLKNYSSGMQVRLAFSIAIRAKSDILLIDEVLAVGDSLFQQKCYDYFDKIKQSDTTVIFVSHDMGAIQSFCDRAILLDKSRLIIEGKPVEVVKKYSEVVAASAHTGKFETPDLQHIGVGGAEILGAKLINSQGKDVEKLDEGEPFSVEIHYKTSQKIDDPVFGIGIMGGKGQSIIGPNTKESGFRTGPLGKRGYVVAKFSSNPLASGVYRIRAGLMNTSVTIPYDFVEDLMSFTIVGKKRYGDIYINPEWEVKAKKA